MRLSRQTNLAVRMLMYCAANDGKLSTINQIANAYAVSAMHLSQVLKPIVDAGLVQTVRGRAGGIRLARPAGSITLGDVLRATETTMTGRTDCDEEDVVDTVLQTAFDTFIDALSRYTIADLVQGMPGLRDLLRVA